MSAHHSFDIDLAQKYGIEEAILIHHFEHWIGINKRKNKNFRDGRTWTYQTYSDIASNFPYLNERKVRYTISRLIEEEIILVGNFNKNKYDQTLWYSLDFQKISLNNTSVLPSDKIVSSTVDKIVRPIPDTIPDAKNTPPTPSKGDECVASLDKLDIEEISKKVLSSRYSVKEIDTAVEATLQIPKRKSDIAVLKTALRENWKPKAAAATAKASEEFKSWFLRLYDAIKNRIPFGCVFESSSGFIRIGFSDDIQKICYNSEAFNEYTTREIIKNYFMKWGFAGALC